MEILLIIVSFLLFTVNLHIYLNKKDNVQDTVVRSVLLFSVMIAAFTEVLSLFHAINYHNVFVGWFTFLIVNIGISCNNRFIVFVKNIMRVLSNYWISRTTYDKIQITCGLIIVTLIFIQGILYPPNNCDSMTYHLPRVNHWIQNQSVDHYSTHIFRQIYQPPFAEFVILHLNLLSGSNRLSFIVQFSFLLFSIVQVVLLLKIFKIPDKCYITGIILTVTLPIVILEASSTQNDLVISFFVVSAVYFCYNYLIHNAKDNLVFAGIAIGLSMLTKGTAALYILPVVVIFVMLCLILILKKSIRFVPFFYLISLLLIPLAINMGHFYRNYKLTQNILGTDSRESRMYSNAKMSTVLLISNQIKNVAVHVGCFPFNRLADTLIYKMHSTFGIDINNSGTNFCDMEYHGIVAIPTCEDTAPNTMHFYIIMSSVLLILVMYKKQNKYQFYCFAIYILLILFQTLLFSGLLRWQPWASRLHIPYFLLSIPVVLYAINTISSYRKIMLVIIPLLIIASIIPLSLNVYKPLVYSKYTNNIKVTDPLYKKYFAIRPYLYKEYNEIYDIIKSCQYRMVGLIVGADDWEYPIFDKFTDCKIKYFHINVKNNPSMLLNRGNENIDCIITTIADNSNKIDYNAKIFYNQSPNNKYIWIYR